MDITSLVQHLNHSLNVIIFKLSNINGFNNEIKLITLLKKRLLFLLLIIILNKLLIKYEVNENVMAKNEYCLDLKIIHILEKLDENCITYNTIL